MSGLGVCPQFLIEAASDPASYATGVSSPLHPFSSTADTAKPGKAPGMLLLKPGDLFQAAPCPAYS